MKYIANKDVKVTSWSLVLRSLYIAKKREPERASEREAIAQFFIFYISQFYTNPLQVRRGIYICPNLSIPMKPHIALYSREHLRPQDSNVSNNKEKSKKVCRCYVPRLMIKKSKKVADVYTEVDANHSLSTPGEPAQ